MTHRRGCGPDEDPRGGGRLKVALLCAKSGFATGVERYARSLEGGLRAIGEDAALAYLKRRELRVAGRAVGGIASVWIARALARRGAHDVVHAADPAAATRSCDVVTVHDLLLETHARGAGASAAARLDWALTRRAAKRAPWIVAVSGATRDEILRRWRVEPERVVAIHLGVDHAVFRPAEAPSPALASDRPNLVYVGDDNPRKNVGLAVRAVAELKARHGLDARLVRIGPSRFPAVHGAYRAFAKERGVDLVEPGFLGDAEIAAALSGADAFLWPSLAEGFGLPPLEAMACGAPVVALDTPINREVCGPTALYHADDPAQAADAVARCLRAPPPKADVLAHARRFTWERTARETRAVYERVVGA